MTIDITGVDLKEFVKKAYEMSIPVGMGHMHYQPGPMSDEDAEAILSGANSPSGVLPGGTYFSMDYFRGRACKISAWEKDGRIVTGDTWYDHTDDQYAELLWHFKIKYKDKKAHGIACHCVVCEGERKKRV